MVVVSGIVEVGASSVEAAITAAAEMAQATRNETGCISYAFYQDIEAPTRFRVFEEWESEEALQAHFQTAHMATFQGSLGRLEILARDIKLYGVSESRSL